MRLFKTTAPIRPSSMKDSLPGEILPENTVLIQDGFEEIEKVTGGNYMIVVTPTTELVVVASSFLEEIRSSE